MMNVWLWLLCCVMLCCVVLGDVVLGDVVLGFDRLSGRVRTKGESEESRKHTCNTGLYNTTPA